MLQGETLTHNKTYQKLPITWKPNNYTEQWCLSTYICRQRNVQFKRGSDCKIMIMMKKCVSITKRTMMQMTKFLTKKKVTIKQKRVEILKCGNIAKKACNSCFETAKTAIAAVVRWGRCKKSMQGMLQQQYLKNGLRYNKKQNRKLYVLHVKQAQKYFLF